MRKVFLTLLIFPSFLIIKANAYTFDNGAELVIKKMWESFEKGDHKMFAETMAKDPEMISFGTDASERWEGWEALQKSVKEQFDAFDIKKVKRMKKNLKFSNSGEVAWFSEVVDWEFLIAGKEQVIEGVRYTGVMEKKDKQWKIVQFHSSVGVSGQVIAY